MTICRKSPVAWFARLPDISVPSPAWSTKWWKPAKKPTKVANKIESEREKAIAYHDTVAPYLDEIRSHIDDLELMVDNQMWPLPKYRELLFIR